MRGATTLQDHRLPCTKEEREVVLALAEDRTGVTKSREEEGAPGKP